MSVLGKLEIFNSTYHWKIQNFSSIDDSAVGAQVLSPVFETQHHRSKQLRWQLILYPGGYDKDNKENLGLCLQYLSDQEVSVTYSFAILDDKLNNVIVCTSGKEFPYKKNQHWGTKKFCTKALIEKRALVNDSITISCTITVRSKDLEDDLRHDPDESVKSYNESLLESGNLSDVTFEIGLGQKEMRLHKVIVSSLSPVFQAMFQHEMREKEESVVQIPDVEYEVMKELFRYIYVRKANDIESVAGELLAAADKYDVEGLKILCEEVLARDLNADNALQRLELAIKYNTTFLKSKAMEFIVNRLDDFVDRPEFQQMDGYYKNELFRVIARNKDMYKPPRGPQARPPIHAELAQRYSTPASRNAVAPAQSVGMNALSKRIRQQQANLKQKAQNDPRQVQRQSQPAASY